MARVEGNHTPAAALLPLWGGAWCLWDNRDSGRVGGPSEGNTTYSLAVSH